MVFVETSEYHLEQRTKIKKRLPYCTPDAAKPIFPIAIGITSLTCLIYLEITRSARDSLGDELLTNVKAQRLREVLDYSLRS